MCTNLESIEIPNSVKSIGHNCTSLTKIKIPEGVLDTFYNSKTSKTTSTRALIIAIIYQV